MGSCCFFYISFIFLFTHPAPPHSILAQAFVRVYLCYDKGGRVGLGAVSARLLHRACAPVCELLVACPAGQIPRSVGPRGVWAAGHGAPTWRPWRRSKVGAVRLLGRLRALSLLREAGNFDNIVDWSRGAWTRGGLGRGARSADLGEGRGREFEQTRHC